jgi:hypothetical protein
MKLAVILAVIYLLSLTVFIAYEKGRDSIIEEGMKNGDILFGITTNGCPVYVWK